MDIDDIDDDTDDTEELLSLLILVPLEDELDSELDSELIENDEEELLSDTSSSKFDDGPA